MSVISTVLLNEVVRRKDVNDPATALAQLDKEMINALRQERADSYIRDGLDICMFAIVDGNLLQYAGARRPLLLVRGDELIELKAEKVSVGGHRKLAKRFINHELELQPGDAIYLFSDGYTDQFGGPDNKKFLIKRFKELLLSIQHLPMADQRVAIQKAFDGWKGTTPQIDDVLVMGVRMPTS